ncbi:MAG: sodium:proton antiporter, partial [Opitutales bacterium]
MQTIDILASSGGHDYLYGLFFLILALVIGAATRHFLQKVPLPFTVLLLLIGLALGGLNRAYGPHGGHAHDHGDDHASHSHGLWDKLVDTLSGAITWGGNMDGHLILYVFLPILIFEAGFALDVHTFKKSVANAFYLAGPGIVTATLMTGLSFAGLIFLFGGEGGVLSDWNVEMGAFIWLSSMLFGAVVSATDPVAVVALLKELGASKKLGTLIEGESLLNDGTAIVAFVLLIGVVTGAETFIGTGDFLWTATLGFGQIGVAGAFLGVLIGLVAIQWVKKVFNDPMIEITVVLVTSYAVFFICEHFFHVSGVLGLVALGIVMAASGAKRISPEVAHFMHEFWELAAFIANVIIFIVVGVVIAQKCNPEPMDYLILGLVYLSIHLVRAINMGIFYPLMKKTGYGLPKKDAVVVWWGALRGAIGLALALVVYSEHLRYEFVVEDGGSGYSEATTGVYVASADQVAQSSAINPKKLFQAASQSHGTLQISDGKIIGIKQSVEAAEKTVLLLDGQSALSWRDELRKGDVVAVIVGEGTGAKVKATLVGISKRVREQFLFLISGIVLLTLLVNASTVKVLVNHLGLTDLPAVKKLMFTAASGNVSKGCNNEMDLLKGDRFLSGANWSMVRKYLPEAVAYPLSADELAGMDTLSETRRRLLEKEKSSYWGQFKDGVLGPQGLGLLDNNLSEFLDQQGEVPLSERDYLDSVCGSPKFLESIKEWPFFKSAFTERLAVGYDAAKAF